MATDTKSKNNKSGSMFDWSNKQAGVVATAAVAGAAVGFAANMGRKLMMQAATAGGHRDWDEALKAEHQATLALFDKIEATEDNQTTMRATLLAKLKAALSKHAIEEENVVYPAMREANFAHDADSLNGEHGYVKTFLYELENMAKDSPSWLPKVREFRSMIEEHIKMEEEEVFPKLRDAMTDEQNRKVSLSMHKEGLKLA